MSTAGQRCRRGDVICSALSIALSVALYTSTPAAHAQASAQTEAVRQYSIPAGPLPNALSSWGAQSGKQLVFPPDLVAGKTSKGVSGRYASGEALTRLLSGSGVTWEVMGGSTIVLKKAPAPAKAPASKPEQRTEATETKEEVTELERMVVTGTNVRGVAPVGSPLMVIDRETLEVSGHGRVQDFLEWLPQNFSGSASEDSNNDIRARNSLRGQAVDLRGLGASSTLVLINGRRQPAGGLEGAFVDISSIATAAVDRIEILTDGASAIYGADAIGGVVNFVLRKDYEGAETSLRLGSTDGHAEELRISQLFGRSWTGGNLLVGYQYFDRDPLMRKDTHYGSMGGDYRALGGSDFRTPGGSPGSIINPANNLPAYAIPPGQDGTNLSVDDLLPGQANYEVVEESAAIPEQTQHSAFFNVTQSLSERFEVFAEGHYNRREITLLDREAIGFFSVPASNPFYVNPFGTGSVRVNYSLGNDLGGPLVQTGHTETAALAVGARARLGKEWQLQLTANRGREKNDWLWLNNFSSAQANAFLANPDPAVALNVFGDGSANNPATIDAIRSTEVRKGQFDVESFSAIADGPLLMLPAGAARLAVGLDYRDERLEAMRGNYAPATGISTPAGGTVGNIGRSVKAAFGELVLPLLGPATAGARSPKLALSLAGRYESYSDFGSTFNPKVGISYTPTRDVTLRGSWGTSFRAPRFNELSSTANPSRSFGSSIAPDPLSPIGISNVLLITGADPDLSEETADTWTAGFDFKPSRLPGLSLSMSYFRLDYEGKIEPGGNGVLTLQIEDQWSEIITRNPTPEQVQAVCNRPDFMAGTCFPDIAAIIDIRLRNLAAVDVRGVDFSVDYRRDVGPGTLSLGMMGTRLLTYRRAVSSTSPFIDALDTVGRPLDLRLRLYAGWSVGNWSLNTALNYLDGYKALVPGDTVPSWTVVDASLGYRFYDAEKWLDGTRVQLSAINLFDRKPPFVNQLAGFDAANANDLGRSIALNFVKEW